MIVLENAEREDWKRLNALIAGCLRKDLDTYADDMAGLNQRRFPAWVLLQRPDKCERVVRELLLMAEDGYEHTLEPLHQYALLRTLQDALACEQDALAGESDPKWMRKRQHRAEDLDHLGEDSFCDHDFLQVEAIARDVLQDGPMCAHLGIDVRDFMELLPDDIRVEVEEHLKAAAEQRPASTPT